MGKIHHVEQLITVYNKKMLNFSNNWETQIAEIMRQDFIPIREGKYSNICLLRVKAGQDGGKGILTLSGCGTDPTSADSNWQ